MVLQKFEETARDALNKTLFLYSVKLYVGIIWVKVEEFGWWILLEEREIRASIFLYYI